MKLRYLLIISLLSGCGGKSFTPLYEKAQDVFKQQRHTEVVDALNLALPLWKEEDGVENKAKAFEMLGQSYQKLRNPTRAIDAYKEAVALSQDTYDAAYNLASLYLVSDQATQSVGMFRKALQMKKNDPLAYLGLGNAYFELKKYDLAKDSYQKVIRVSPGVKEAMQFINITNKKIKAQRKKRRLRRLTR